MNSGSYLLFDCKKPVCIYVEKDDSVTEVFHASLLLNLNQSDRWLDSDKAEFILAKLNVAAKFVVGPNTRIKGNTPLDSRSRSQLAFS